MEESAEQRPSAPENPSEESWSSTGADPWRESSTAASSETPESVHPAVARALRAGQRKESWRERVGERLAEYPILRTLALNPLFGALVALLILGVVLFGVSLLKIWRISPDGFRPVVRCSLLDLAQAWSLARQGRRHWEAGDYAAAARSYFSASKNKLTDRELLRHALQSFAKTKPNPPSDLFARAGDGSRWLLHLSSTNREDVFLVAQVYDVMDESGSVLALLQPWENELPANLYGVMAKAAFDFDDVEAFARWWRQADGALSQDPLLALYYAAWRAGWGSVEEQRTCREQLQAAAKRLDQRRTADHLLLKVYRHRQDVLNYARTLKELESFEGDRIQDHVEYWLLLKELGRGAEALRLAKRYPYPPQNALQVAAWGKVLYELGDQESAQRLLERYGPGLGDGPAVVTLPLWALLADLYIARREWEPLVRMGRDLRALPRGNTSLSGFGWFVEGRGLLELGRQTAAARAFDNAVQAGLPTAAMSLEIGGTLVSLGYPMQAQALLLPLEETLKNNVRYWRLLFQAAYQAREDEALLFKAARQAFNLDPGNPENQLDYAVALLIGRQRPEAAVKLTLKQLTAHPKDSVARLNHAHALALVGRNSEADALLRSVPPPGDRESQTARALVQLEISLNREDEAGARAALKRIDEQFLFPSQRRWLASVRKRLRVEPAMAAR